MSVNWNYIEDSVQNKKDNQLITFHNDDLKTAGAITSHPKAPERPGSFIQSVRAAIRSLPCPTMYTFSDADKKVHAIVKPVPDYKKIHRQVLYYKSNKSEIINIYCERLPSVTKHYQFEYEKSTYKILSHTYNKNTIQQIYLDEEVVAATMREPGEEQVVRFKAEEKFQKDVWLWLSVLHSLFTETTSTSPHQTVY